MNIFVWKWSKIAAQKKFFFADFAIQNMLETTLPDGLSGFWVFLDHPPMTSVLLSALVERCFVSRMRDFFLARNTLKRAFSGLVDNPTAFDSQAVLISLLDLYDK